MSTSDIHANIARGWNRAPSGSLSGTAATGVSVAIWDYDKNELLEVHGTPDCHLISVQLQPNGTIEIASGGRPTLRGPFPAYACDITQAGETSWARIQGPIKILQFYIPASFLHYLIEAETRIGDSKAVELIDMRGVQDALITRISYETANEIRLAQPFSRLKIDALAQELGIHLLRAHSSIAG